MARLAVEVWAVGYAASFGLSIWLARRPAERLAAEFGDAPEFRVAVSRFSICGNRD
jgi:hypothetical protein